VNRQRVDHPHGVFIMQSLELSDDVTVEIWLLEAEDNHLDGSDSH
jgi:hypothetical protein